MADTAQDATLWSGRDKALAFTLSDAAGEALSLAGASLAWRLSREPGGTALVSKSTSGGIAVASNVATVSLAPAETAALEGFYAHELVVTDGEGNVTTVSTGWLTVNRGASIA